MDKIYLEFKWTVSRGRDSYGYNICTLRADGAYVARCNGGGYDMEGTCLGNYIASAFADRLRQLTPRQMPKQSHWEAERARVCSGVCHDKFIEAHTEAIVNETAPPQPVKLPHDCYECPTCKGPTHQSRDGKQINDGHYFYGLVFVDPKYDPMNATLKRADNTFTKKEDVGKTFRELKAEGKIVDLELIRAWYSATSKTPTIRHTVPSIDGACGMSSVQKIASAIGLTFEYIPVRSKNLNAYFMHDKQKQKAAA